MGKKFAIGSFIVGGLVGAVVALLYAPRPGSETRALVADKVDEIWGQGQAYTQSAYAKIQEGFSVAQPIISQKNDELREKIESARAIIAEQVAKNAAAARDAINDKVPIAGEKIHQAVDVVKGQIDAAASKLKGVAADKDVEDASDNEVVDVVVADDVVAEGIGAADNA